MELFCIARFISFKVAYFQGVQITLADCLSRSLAGHHKWSLHPDVSNAIFQRWDITQVDLFATKENNKCDLFLFPGGSQLGVIVRCFPSELVKGLVVCLPSSSASAQHLVQDQTRCGSHHTTSPSVAWLTLIFFVAISPIGENPIPLLRDVDVISQDNGRLFHQSTGPPPDSASG